MFTFDKGLNTKGMDTRFILRVIKYFWIGNKEISPKPTNTVTKLFIELVLIGLKYKSDKNNLKRKIWDIVFLLKMQMLLVT